MPDKYLAGITNEELGAIYMNDYMTLTLMGDKAQADGYDEYAQQMWGEAFGKLDLGYKALGLGPPDTLSFFKRLKDVGIN